MIGLAVPFLREQKLSWGVLSTVAIGHKKVIPAYIP